MASHNVPTSLLASLTAGPSSTKIGQVAAMQNYIQGLLGDTHHTFLQGSYRNDTAPSAINDVDIVAIRLRTFSCVYTGKSFPTSIPWNDIFTEIELKLKNQQKYSWTVTRGDKCIKVRGAFNADIVPAVQVNDDHLVDPIVVYSFKTFAEKLNHPRVHYQNGVAKQAATQDRYKSTVRMFKNWRQNHFGDGKDIISSFKVEALVHAAPNEHFTDDPVTNFLVIAHGIIQRFNAQGFAPITSPSVCGSEDIFAGWDLTNRGYFRAQLQQSLQYGIQAYDSKSQSPAEEMWRKVFNL
jgi:hypothetical protein